jgi:hypothetical protein
MDTNRGKKPASKHHNDSDERKTEAATKSEGYLGERKGRRKHHAKNKEGESLQPLRKRILSWLQSLLNKQNFPAWVGAISTLVLAIVTIVYTVYAQRTLAITKENFLREERPYVWITSARPLLARTYPGDLPTYNRLVTDIYIADFGKTPALGAVIITKIVTGPSALAQADEFFKSGADAFMASHQPSGNVIVPGIPSEPSHTWMWRSAQSDPLSPADLQYILAHENSAMVVVRITYFDYAGQKHRSDLCLNRLLTGALEHYREHNELE